MVVLSGVHCKLDQCEPVCVSGGTYQVLFGSWFVGEQMKSGKEMENVVFIPPFPPLTQTDRVGLSTRSRKGAKRYIQRKKDNDD